MIMHTHEQFLQLTANWWFRFRCAFCIFFVVVILFVLFAFYARFSFWATVCKTVCPMLSDRCLSVYPVCLSCLSVHDVGVLWPNGWMDQDETWHAGRPRTWPHCVSWGPSSPSPKWAQPLPQFLVHICCGQLAGWIKTPLGMEVCLGSGTLY